MSYLSQKRISMVLFSAGLLLALTGATMMFCGIAPISLRITIGIIGISLIGTSGISISAYFAKSKK